MIDIENIVFDKIQSLIVAEYPSACVESTNVTRASSFPCICFYESDNSVYGKTQDLDNRENHANVTYECNIYTSGNLSKSQAKKIAVIVDNAMNAMGFTRTYKGQTPNIERTIYRFTLRYTGVVARGVAVGDDIIYKIYNK